MSNTPTTNSLLETMVASLVHLITLGHDLHGNRAQAVAYAKARTCAGPRAWTIALERTAK